MRTRAVCSTWIAACAALACSDAPRNAPARPLGREAVLASFVAEVDAVAGTLTIRADPPPNPAAALVQIPDVQDGEPGSGPAETVELVTETVAGAVADGCAPGLSSFEGTIRVRSFHAARELRNVHVELTGLTATGYEACASAFPAPDPGVDRRYGLFPYGTLTRAGSSGDSAVATWKFRYPSATSFTFWGRVMGEPVVVAPPAVVAISPADGSTQTPGEIAITFSEPMAVATTSAAISLSGPGGPVTGTIAASQGDRVFTFTPSVRLAPATAYTVAVAPSATDTLGAPLGTPYSAAFTTAAQQVSGIGSATLEPGGLAFDAAGNGLVVWRTGGGTSARAVQYSYYSAASAEWSEPLVLGLDGGDSPPRVAASTTQFAVAWNAPDGVRVAIFTNGVAGTATLLASMFVGYYHAVASSGSGFAVVWAGSNATYSSIWDGVAWTARSVASDTYASFVSVVGTGSGYRALWLSGSSVRASTWAAGAWTAAETLGTSGTGVSPAIAASSTVTCMVWSDGGIGRARAERGGTGTTSFIGLPASAPTAVAVAALGDRCQVAAATPGGVLGASYGGATWTTLASIGFGTSPADAVAVAPLGTSEFAVVARVLGATSSDLLVNRSSGFSFGGAAVTVDAAAAAARHALAAPAGSSVRVAFAQADGAADRIRTARIDAASVGAPVALGGAVLSGPSAAVRLAADGEGNQLALWEQQHLGRTSVFYAHRTGGVWGPAQILAADATSPVVASRGIGFVAAWQTTASATTKKIASQRFVDGSWTGAPATVAEGSSFYTSLAIGTDRTGYAVACIDGSGLSWAALGDGASWTPRQLPAPRYATAVLVAGRPGEYLFVWCFNNTYSYQRASGSGSTWSWDSGAPITGSGPVTPAVVGGPNGFLVVYHSSSTTPTIDARFISAGVLGSAATLRPYASECSRFAAASNGSTYFAVTGCSSTSAAIQSHVSDGASWNAARTVRPGSYIAGLAAASDGVGYAVLADGWPSHGGLAAIAAPEPVAGAFGAPVTLGAGSGDGEHGALVGSTGGFVAAWKQPEPANVAVHRIYASGL